MYDLNHLRAQLRKFIEGLGWVAVMAENGSFAIDANQTTVTNSLKNVRENADVFVMIVGARYGSIDPDTDKSVTNLEFLEARARRIPTYVFVDSDVVAQLGVWRSNPDADYSGVVDTPRVFEFIDSFRGSGDVWTFPFAAAEDIVDTLCNQFAYLVQDAFALRQMAHGRDLLLEKLDGPALMVALRRDPLWELRLFGTVLETELDRRAPLRTEIKYRLGQADVTHIALTDFEPWAQDRLHEFSRSAQTATAIVNDYLPQTIGNKGVPEGDPIQIAAAANRLAQVWEDSANWTLRCRAVRVIPGAERVVDLLSTLNANMLNEIWEFGHNLIPQIDAAIEQHTGDSPEVVTMTLTLTVDEDELNEEIARFAQSLLP